MRPVIAFLALVAALVYAQTETVLDPDGSGNSIVEVITIDPEGVPTTTVIATLTPTTADTTTTTDDSQQQGPVGAPAPTITGQETTYKYTTTDANGVTTVIHDTFTATFPTTQSPPSQTLVGSILGYSQWLASIGTNTVPAVQNGADPFSVPSRVWGMSVSVLAGALGGAWLIVA